MRSRVLAALAVAMMVLTGCGFHGLYGMHLPGGADVGSNPYSLTIYFDNVLDLVPQSAVKVNDVPVGRVENVTLSNPNDDSGDHATNGWTAKVTVSVNSDVKLPENARAEIKQTSLLGEKYVDLEQPLDAPSSTRLKSGDTIPITRTGSAPETEQVLGALSLLLNGGGLQQIKIITTELNKALDGNEPAIRDLLGQLNTFVGTINQQRSKILDTLDKVNQLAITLKQNKKTITDALDTFPQALSVLRANRSKLTTMLVSLANLGTVATHVINATQFHFVSALKSLAPAVEQLTASGSNLVSALKIAGTFPFPLKTTLNAVKGDYANLAFYLDLNLSDELCAVNQQLCGVVRQAKTQSSSTRALPSAVTRPTLVGTGG
ncbi:MAG TPA: MCE family protein [Jatrophihabitans sp.]|jgi:phospholipid/cholesterol/gamma-HCH transport system substrate-binding protein